MVAVLDPTGVEAAPAAFRALARCATLDLDSGTMTRVHDEETVLIFVGSAPTADERARALLWALSGDTLITLNIQIATPGTTRLSREQISRLAVIGRTALKRAADRTP